MRTLILTVVIASLIGFSPSVGPAQRRPVDPRAAQPPKERAGTELDEIKLDQVARLTAIALEAQISALAANFALLRRRAQDMQVELNRLFKERKMLIEQAAKAANIEVKDTTKWAFDKNGQRYVRVKKTP